MKNYEQKNHCDSGKLIKAMYSANVYVYIFFVQAKFLLNPDTNVPNYTVSYPTRHLYRRRFQNTNFCKMILVLILHCLEFMIRRCEKYWATCLPLMRGK